MRDWRCVYELDRKGCPVSGSPEALAGAIRRAADLRIYTTFDWNEHMRSRELAQGRVEESIDLRVTYLLGDRWTAGLTATRFPANAGLGFFERDPSLSFFMYNQTGQFGIARPYLTRSREAIPTAPGDFGPFYHALDGHEDPRSPCHNAVYEFDTIRWLVADDWQEALSHDADGRVRSGSLEALCEAFRAGASVKVAVRGLCDDLAAGAPAIVHEVFVELGSMYHHRDKGFHSGESLPLVRIAPGIPLQYAGGNWSFGWVLPRTDGEVFRLDVDPYTREFRQACGRHAIRWFVR